MNIQFRNNNIILIGDSHDLRRLFTIIQRKPNIDNFDILSLGDNGIGFCGREFDQTYLNRINDECVRRNINLYALRGNHDDPKIWTEGRYIHTNLFLIPDYSSAQFPNNKKALLVGGGISIDRPSRREGLDYWQNENTEYIKQDKHFDYLFSHDTADYFNHSTDSLRISPYKDFLLDDAYLYDDCLTQRLVINKIIQDITPKYCFSGHYHNNIKEEVNGVKYQCLKIEELFEFDSEKY